VSHLSPVNAELVADNIHMAQFNFDRGLHFTITFLFPK